MNRLIERLAGNPPQRRRRMKLADGMTVPVIVLGRTFDGRYRVHLARTGPTQTMLVPASALHG